MESIRVVVTSRIPGEAVQSLELFTRAYDECVELRQQSRDEWIGRALLALQDLDRFELAAFVGDKMAGGIVLAHDPWDVHVGPCMSVFAQYVLPEYRLRGISPRLMREGIRIAKQSGVSTLAFTHRKGPWRYETAYRRIRHEKAED